jgi:hypothetical protein
MREEIVDRRVTSTVQMLFLFFFFIVTALRGPDHVFAGLYDFTLLSTCPIS